MTGTISQPYRGGQNAFEPIQPLPLCAISLPSYLNAILMSAKLNYLFDQFMPLSKNDAIILNKCNYQPIFCLMGRKLYAF